MKTFDGKTTLATTAARCVGLLISMYQDPCRVHEDDQLFLEGEYVALYAYLQDLSFFKDGKLKWLFLSELEKHKGVVIAKSEYGLALVYKEMSLEVAPVRTVYSPEGRRDIRIKASELRNATRHSLPLHSDNLVRGTTYRNLDWSKFS